MGSGFLILQIMVCINNRSKPIFPTVDDDGAARMVEGKFLNIQPHFCSHDYWKL
ncbi:hypothetical protein HanXRQr2_Chr04g0171151 [Helianthus annuus]|uniref:Uncharacterized protein n=1 Tax=Helianthus annuus TaxID=4232 RepID=A0A9K3J8W5_HELAN|nr:hypothetical protein HanXRQr2_Chr04g0171151 [Helianthus annuus]KAJ0589319.1 hypothetical protein HanIR_Chr04g0184781 [Helianthus annuus]KAJ0931690.1 hypothetical protein HanPSC8_Chr04g0164761 [Helianthus annuus]